MITKFNNNIVLSFDHCSFDQLKMSNHSLTAWGTDLPFSHKSVVSIVITHEQNIICSKTPLCRQLFAGHVVGSWPMKRKEKVCRMIITVTAVIIFFYPDVIPVFSTKLDHQLNSLVFHVFRS